jgi:hypothetical protein
MMMINQLNKEVAWEKTGVCVSRDFFFVDNSNVPLVMMVKSPLQLWSSSKS